MSDHDQVTDWQVQSNPPVQHSFSDFLLCVYFVQDGWTPLHVASEEGKQEIVQVLLGANADVNLASTVSDKQFSGGCAVDRQCLHMQCELDREQTRKMH